MPYWRLFYHLIWACKDRRPSIGPVEEEIIRASMKLTIADLDLIDLAIGMMPDHVHVVVSIPPKVAVADAVRRLKGASTHALNESKDRREEPTFAWQSEYGALSFGDKQLEGVVSYAENQRALHAINKLWPKLETFTQKS